MTASFALSYAALCAAQGVTVGVVRAAPWLRLRRLESRWWALVPVGALVGTVAVIAIAGGAAHLFTYLALVAVPPLAAFALGYLVRRARPVFALAAVPLFALAWVERGTLVGDAAAVSLSACSCIALGALLAANAPRRWLEAGIVAMACVDTVLVSAQLLQGPDKLLNAARPGGGLPQLQFAEFGNAVMGYGDLFIAAVLGALLAADRVRQVRAAILTTAFGLAFGTLFFAVNTLPATVPVAAAMLVSARWPSAARRRPAAAVAAPRPRPAPPGSP